MVNQGTVVPVLGDPGALQMVRPECCVLDSAEWSRLRTRAIQVLRRSNDPSRCLQMMRAKAEELMERNFGEIKVDSGLKVNEVVPVQHELQEDKEEKRVEEAGVVKRDQEPELIAVDSLVREADLNFNLQDVQVETGDDAHLCSVRPALKSSSVQCTMARSSSARDKGVWMEGVDKAMQASKRSNRLARVWRKRGDVQSSLPCTPNAGEDDASSARGHRPRGGHAPAKSAIAASSTRATSSRDTAMEHGPYGGRHNSQLDDDCLVEELGSSLDRSSTLWLESTQFDPCGINRNPRDVSMPPLSSAAMPTGQISALNCLVWNCHGGGNSTTVQDLLALIKANNPRIVFLCETRQKKEKMRRYRRRFNLKGFAGMSSNGMSGRLALYWDDSLHVDVQDINK